MDGRVTVGRVEKQPSGEMIGDTTNGINRVTGEPFGNPTPNQIAMAIRDLEARTRLSAEAKRNLVKLKNMGKKDKQDAALRRLERNMVDTGPDKSGRPLNRGGAIKAKSRTGHMDYRKGGLFK
jgi:hypothetical protein